MNYRIWKQQVVGGMWVHRVELNLPHERVCSSDSSRASSSLSNLPSRALAERGNALNGAI